MTVDYPGWGKSLISYSPNVLSLIKYVCLPKVCVYHFWYDFLFAWNIRLMAQTWDYVKVAVIVNNATVSLHHPNISHFSWSANMEYRLEQTKH